MTASTSAALAACSSSPPVRHYSLGPLAHSAGDVTAASPDSSAGAGPSLIVGPVSLPDVIDRPQIVRIVDGVRVEVADTHRWSGSLRNEIARRLATGSRADLARVGYCGTRCGQLTRSEITGSGAVGKATQIGLVPSIGLIAPCGATSGGPPENSKAAYPSRARRST